jgi:CubicO group peptidase (beta-lactamase class C family)
MTDLAGDVRRFRQQQVARLPVRPWSDLAASVPPAVLDGFTSYPDVMQSAVVRGGVLYRTDCPTAAGPFPYCDDVRYGVWSETKTAMMNIALLRLAQKYGRGFLDQPIADYVPAAASGGWQDVTFRDLANMASGHGPAGQPTCYLCDYDRWYVALSREDKTLQALDYPRFTAAGTLFNYRDQDAYLLGVAEDAFLKAHEGPSASIWELVRREVYAPLGIHHAPSNSTVEPDGSQGHPLMAYGYYPTLDDLAKISLLYQYRGAWNARQLLDRELVRELLPSPPGPPSGALPASSDGSAFYELNWWFQRARSTEGCTRFLPQMEGWGGNTVTLLPGHMVVLRMRNLWVDSPHSQTSIDRLADALTSMCP